MLLKSSQCNGTITGCPQSHKTPINLFFTGVLTAASGSSVAIRERFNESLPGNVEEVSGNDAGESGTLTEDQFDEIKWDVDPLETPSDPFHRETLFRRVLSML